MDFLRSIGSAIAGGVGDIGSFLGLNNNNKQQQQQAAQDAQNAKNNAQAPQQSQNDQSGPVQIPSLNLFQGAAPLLQKATAQQPPQAPTPPPTATLAKAPLTPQQQASQAFLNASGGPINPNYISATPGLAADALEAVKGIGHTLADPGINAYNSVQTNQAAANAQYGAGSPEAILHGIGGFVKGIGTAGAEYAGYVAPEIKALDFAGEAAPALQKFGSSLLAHGATSVPLSVAGSLASGNRDPLSIAGNAGAAALTAGTVPALRDIKGPEVVPGVTSANPDVAAANEPAEIAPGLKVTNPGVPGEPGQVAPPGAPENAPLPAGQPNPTVESSPGPSKQPPGQPVENPAAPPPAAGQFLENSSSPDNVSQTLNTVKPGDAPAAEQPPSVGPTAPNAPNVRASLTKQLGDAGSAAGDVTKHDVLSNDDLNTAAGRVVANTPDDELLSHYSGVPDLGKAADLAHANATLPRLAELTKSADPEVSANATKGIDNILEGAEKATSGAGRTLNYAQSMYDTLPKEAKISLTIRTLDKARDAGGMAKIADDAPFRSQVEATLNNLLTKGEDIRGQLAAVEGKVQEITDAAKTPGVAPPPDAEAQLNQLSNEQSELDLAAKVQNGETARYYDSLVPGKAGLQKAADFARTSMLTAPSGRLNNVLNVGGNSLYELARSGLQAGLGKGVNAVTKTPGAASDGSLLNGGLAQGAKAGLQKVAAQFRGDQIIPDIKGSLNPSKAGGNYGLSRTANNSGLNKVANWTHAALTAPSEVIGGALKQAQLVRSAAQEGEKMGLAGDDLKVYTQGRSLLPSSSMADAANALKDQVSHMNHNPFADFVGKSFLDNKGPGNAQGFMGLLKNTFLPFPKYAATFAWNTLTDRNVVADAVRAVNAARTGDIDGLTRAISGAAIDGTGMYLGYHLADQGIITNKDAQGDSDGGMYFHLGDRYIPLGTIGVGAETLMAGGAYHDAVNAGGNAVKVFGDTIGNTILNTLKAAGTQNVVGAGDTALTDIQNAVLGENGVSAADAGAAILGQGAGQFIPGALSDVNAVLNHTPLNPTGEAALTKATKGEQGVVTGTGAPSTAKDIPASTLNALENRIPVVSQLAFPRNPGVAAADPLDRVTRGDHATPTELQEAADTQKAANASASDKAAGIPDPNAKYKAGDSFANALETTIEKGNYDAASQGLQQKLDKLNGDPNIPDTVKAPVQNQIKQLSVLKAGNFTPDVRSLYDKTSLTAWRDMGDPTKATYDPATYQKLYAYDSALAKNDIAGISATGSVQADPGVNKYSAKAASTKSGAAGSLKVGTLKAPTQITPVTLSLSPQKINAVPVPAIAKLTPETLIKNHAISVTPDT